MKPLRLAWANLTVGDDNGYAIIANSLASSLQGAGAVILSEDAAEVMTWDRVVTVGLPTAWPFAPGERGPNWNWHTYLPMKPWPFAAKARRDDLIWHTMLEVDSLPPGWADVLNRCGLVWTPSFWVEAMFRRSGVTAEIMTAGYGIDPKIFYPNPSPLENRAMRWGVWADDWGTRKHAELGIDAWVKAGLEEATLDVRLTNVTQAPTSPHLSRPDIRLLTGRWSRERLAGWLRSLDALIFLSGGEGFGLMPLEAMACGLPVVCAFNTGMIDFLTDFNSLLVMEHTPEPAYGYAGRWAAPEDYLPNQLLPDLDEAISQIRWAGEHRDYELRMVGVAASSDAGQRTWAAAGKTALAGLERRIV